MDVRCSRCSTEYEFDDDKVSGAGVTVKCSTCGHVFKVTQTDEQMPAPISAMTSENSDWLVQKKDGTVVRFKELTSLQKWIVEQKVERSDQISKTGQTWKRLGEIAELASFFQVVDAANVAVVQPTLPSVLQRVVPQNPPTSAPPAPEYFMDATASLSDGAELSVLDDDDPVLQWQRRSKRRKVALFLAVTTLVALGGAAFWKPDEAKKLLAPLLATLGKEQGKEALSDGDRKRFSEQTWVALQSGRYSPTEKSLRSLEAVNNREDPFLQALVSILHIELARIESERARLLKLQSGKTRAVQSAQDSAKSHLSLADENTSRARRRAPTNSWVILASAALHGSAGRPAEMQADLDGLAVLKAPLPALVVKEASALPSLLKAQNALFTTSIDEQDAALALISKKDFADDARFVYLESALRAEKLLKKKVGSDEVDDVVKEADALLATLAPFHVSEKTDVRGSVQAARLQFFLEHLSKKAAGIVPDAGIQTAETDAKTKVDDGSPPPSKNADGKKTNGKKTNAKKAQGTEAEYQKLLARADRARIADRTRSSLKFYKKAHHLREHEAKPLVGMGWAYIDLGRSAKAVGVFKRARIEDPSVVVAQFGLAEAYGVLGEKAAAIRAYKKYLRIAPGGSDAADAKAALKRLQR